MSLGKILAFTALILAAVLGVAAWLKESKTGETPASTVQTVPSGSEIQSPVEVELEVEETVQPLREPEPAPKTSGEVQDAKVSQELPEADRIQELFSTKGAKLPLVETITYKSKVSWLKGRPAWLSDYASHYETSRHFIARSLNGKPDYLKQDVAEGAKFNVLRKELPLHFHLVVDASRCKMWFYAVDESSQSKTLLKTYIVGLGRPDATQASGLLTPLGKYSLGNRVAIYKPGVMGNHKGQRVEMISVFGTRWIPFEKEIAQTTAPAKGLGIHGVPWNKKADGTYVQDLNSLKDYKSDGCVRMAKEDVEELFAIILTKDTIVEIVPEFHQSEMAR
jgi:hypothetical protein